MAFLIIVVVIVVALYIVVAVVVLHSIIVPVVAFATFQIIVVSFNIIVVEFHFIACILHLLVEIVGVVRLIITFFIPHQIFFFFFFTLHALQQKHIFVMTPETREIMPATIKIIIHRAKMQEFAVTPHICVVSLQHLLSK